MKIPECMTRRPTPAEFNAALRRPHDAGALADASRPLAIANDHGELVPLFASHGPGTIAAMAFTMAAALLDATERADKAEAEVAELRAQAHRVETLDSLLAELDALPTGLAEAEADELRSTVTLLLDAGRGLAAALNGLPDGARTPDADDALNIWEYLENACEDAPSGEVTP